MHQQFVEAVQALGVDSVPSWSLLGHCARQTLCTVQPHCVRVCTDARNIDRVLEAVHLSTEMSGTHSGHIDEQAPAQPG